MLNESAVMICGSCAKGFVNESQLSEHMSSHAETKRFECGKGELVFLTFLELEGHIETEHDPSGPKCKNCDFVASDGSMLKVHEQTNHMGVKVNIDIKEQTVIACEQCDYTN